MSKTGSLFGYLVHTIRAEVIKVNEHLREVHAAFALTDDQVANLRFYQGGAERAPTGTVPVEDTVVPDEYRTGRLVGRVYHRTINPPLFAQNQPGDVRQRKLEWVAEHLGAMLMHYARDDTVFLDGLIDEYSTARDPQLYVEGFGSYSIEDETRIREYLQQEGMREESIPAPGGFDIIRDIQQEEKKGPAGGEELARREQERAIEERLADLRGPEFSNPVDISSSIDMGDYAAHEAGYGLLGSIAKRREQDAFLIALALMTQNDMGPSYRTMDSILRSSKTDALAALEVIFS
ncbi:hypothetical protein GF342_03740 [Candidatus Woesearchaeota archaeon]|nr:hypothetical protein [Candidatus Woesearchaeota archaeon]